MTFHFGTYHWNKKIVQRCQNTVQGCKMTFVTPIKDVSKITLLFFPTVDPWNSPRGAKSRYLPPPCKERQLGESKSGKNGGILGVGSSRRRADAVERDTGDEARGSSQHHPSGRHLHSAQTVSIHASSSVLSSPMPYMPIRPQPLRHRRLLRQAMDLPFLLPAQSLPHSLFLHLGRQPPGRAFPKLHHSRVRVSFRRNPCSLGFYVGC